MISVKAIEHCLSVGTDKNGFTLCRDCPSLIRTQCIKHSGFSAEDIKDHAMRVNRAVEEYYGDKSK